MAFGVNKLNVANPDTNVLFLVLILLTTFAVAGYHYLNPLSLHFFTKAVAVAVTWMVFFFLFTFTLFLNPSSQYKENLRKKLC